MSRHTKMPQQADSARRAKVEFSEMHTYTFLSCDVTKPERAAKALLKALNAAGYTTGIEIKEVADNGRVWKLE